MRVIPVLAVAPCQCLTFGGIQTTSHLLNFLNLTAPLPNPARTSRNDQSLTQRMAVPHCASPGFEGDAPARHVRGWIFAEKRINTCGTGKVFGWALRGGLRTTSRYFDCLRALGYFRPGRIRG